MECSSLSLSLLRGKQVNKTLDTRFSEWLPIARELIGNYAAGITKKKDMIGKKSFLFIAKHVLFITITG